MSNNISIEFKKNNLENNILFDGDDTLFKNLISEVKTYFEYGCGKSTEYMYKKSNASIYSVDTSKEWATKTLNLSKDSNHDRLNGAYMEGIWVLKPWSNSFF